MQASQETTDLPLLILERTVYEIRQFTLHFAEQPASRNGKLPGPTEGAQTPEDDGRRAAGTLPPSSCPPPRPPPQQPRPPPLPAFCCIFLHTPPPCLGGARTSLRDETRARSQPGRAQRLSWARTAPPRGSPPHLSATDRGPDGSKPRLRLPSAAAQPWGVAAAPRPAPRRHRGLPRPGRGGAARRDRPPRRSGGGERGARMRAAPPPVGMPAHAPPTHTHSPRIRTAARSWQAGSVVRVLPGEAPMCSLGARDVGNERENASPKRLRPDCTGKHPTVLRSLRSGCLG